MYEVDGVEFYDEYFDEVYGTDIVPMKPRKESFMSVIGDLKPEEAILQKNGCMDKMIADPDEEGYCYDDEDK